MGLIDKNRIADILSFSKDEIQKMAGNIEALTLYELYLLIIFIAQYLYAYCAHDGRLVGSNYVVVPNTLASSGKFGIWSDYAIKIVQVRNTICHSFGIRTEMQVLNSITNNRKQIIRFLKFLGIIEEQKSDPLAELMAASTAAIR